jgi:SnoaL-like polyketide cyclase
MKNAFSRNRATSAAAVLTLLLVAACAAEPAKTAAASPGAPFSAAAADSAVEKHLLLFDTLDFDVFSNQKWDRLSESHADDIIVTWPDGHDTKGIAKHIDDLKAMFVYAPDIRISEHPIRFGQGEWTSVQGFMTGTFTKPMPIGPGKFIPPTNKAFRISMVTVGHWKNGKMDHEWLFWDGSAFMKQLGLAR